MNFFTTYAPTIGIVCLAIVAGFAVTYFFKHRHQKHLTRLYQDIARDRENECRKWREMNITQRNRLAVLAEQVQSFNPQNDKHT